MSNCACGCGQTTTLIKRNDSFRGEIQGEYRRFVRGHSTPHGEANRLWKGGRNTSHHKYVLVLSPDHPHANRKGYVSEHVLVATKALGHALPPNAVVHHHDKNGFNNAPDNLVICENAAYHVLIHRRTRALKACGNAHFRRCIYCKAWDDPARMYISPEGKGSAAFHRDCKNKNWRERNALRRREQ
jgi:HNH endonuclease